MGEGSLKPIKLILATKIALASMVFTPQFENSSKYVIDTF